ncbi:MAG: HAMP domain-containing protein [Gemmatimonadetes bacterium]|nr:HAMP domain-containing protein [Gemmatimonadota bacterium]
MRGVTTPKLERIASITSSLSFRLILVLFLTLFLLFFVQAALVHHFGARILEGQVRADAYRASDFIKQSLLTSMLRNERERIYETINLLGAESGIEVIRIYNKTGEIKFSSHREEIGRAVDLRAEACYLCHATDRPLQVVPTEHRARIYSKGRDGHGQHRVLGVINPIRNAEGCWNGACHAHTPDQTILGVLDVQMSMEALDAALVSSERDTYIPLGVAIILVSALLMAGIVYYAVHLPARKLRRGSEALARGNLDVEIDLNRSDELGQFARSFNQMARNLKAAYAELRAWSQTLEDRVRQKTEELERIHEHMVQVEKAASLGKMAATVAHELNNPLSGILTYAKLVAKKLSRHLPDGEEKGVILGDLELIRSESLRCGHIVRDLLIYARESTPEFQPAHLHEVIQRALKLVEHHTELGEVRTETDFGLDDDVLICDADQIVQALIALLINALEAMPDGGRLTVRTGPSPGRPLDWVCLGVSDTGVGIPEEIRDKIFDPFFSTKSDTKGVGLGLAVVYGIVQRHHGEISVNSAPGAETTFTLELPRDPGEAARGSRGHVAAGIANHEP